MQELYPCQTKSGKKNQLLFGLLFVSLLFMVACAGVKISEIDLCPLEDPFTGEGYCVNVLTGEETVYSPEDWRKRRRNYVMMSPESWATIKKDNYKNCYTFECKQTLQNIDNLFLEIDKAVSAAGVLK